MRIMRLSVLCCAILLNACAEQPKPAPIIEYQCSVPLPMTDPVAWPEPPAAPYTQKDVAAYLETAIKPNFDMCNGRLADLRNYLSKQE